MKISVSESAAPQTDQWLRASSSNCVQLSLKRTKKRGFQLEIVAQVIKIECSRGKKGKLTEFSNKNLIHCQSWVCLWHRKERKIIQSKKEKIQHRVGAKARKKEQKENKFWIERWMKIEVERNIVFWSASSEFVQHLCSSKRHFQGNFYTQALNCVHHSEVSTQLHSLQVSSRYITSLSRLSTSGVEWKCFPLKSLVVRLRRRLKRIASCDPPSLSRGCKRAECASCEWDGAWLSWCALRD